MSRVTLFTPLSSSTIRPNGTNNRGIIRCWDGTRISSRINEDFALIKFALNELHFIEILVNRSLKTERGNHAIDVRTVLILHSTALTFNIMLILIEHNVQI